jgi:hypothetical protein
MLELLEDELACECGLDFLTDPPIEIANQVLTFLEKHGMAPPEVIEWTATPNTFLGKDFSIAVTKRKWEQEDELP